MPEEWPPKAVFACANLNTCVLVDLGDVVLAALANGDILQWNAAAMQWQNVPLPPSAATMEFFEKASDPDANIGTHPAQRLIDGQDITVRIEFLVPHDFTAIHTAEIILVPGGTGNLRRSVATNFGTCGEVKDVHTDSIAAGEVAVTINEIECLDISAALTGIAAGDFVGIEFTRHASHANDTVDADCYFLGFRFRYT